MSSYTRRSKRATDHNSAWRCSRIENPLIQKVQKHPLGKSCYESEATKNMHAIAIYFPFSLFSKIGVKDEHFLHDPHSEAPRIFSFGRPPCWVVYDDRHVQKFATLWHSIACPLLDHCTPTTMGPHFLFASHSSYRAGSPNYSVDTR